jgi:hypothetical protein
MGLSLSAYFILAATGWGMFYTRRRSDSRPWLRLLHLCVGSSLVILVVGLLSIGVIGTLGEYGNLGHSSHLLAGVVVVSLVILSAGSALQIRVENPWARPLHVGTNLALFVGFLWVSWTGWSVVQQYLP